MQSAADYTKSPSLSDIAPAWGAQITPHVLDGVVSRPLEHTEVFLLDGTDAFGLMAHLIDTDQRRLVERTLQGICQTANGEKLLSAFLGPEPCRQLANEIGRVDLARDIATWIGHGCNEVVLDFLDGRSRVA